MMILSLTLVIVREANAKYVLSSSDFHFELEPDARNRFSNRNRVKYYVVRFAKFGIVEPSILQKNI